jgi:hypothetical protein
MGENRGGQVAAVALLFLVLSWIFVGLRCYVRTAMMKSFGLHDWLAVVSLVSNLLGLDRSSSAILQIQSPQIEKSSH